MVTDKDLVIIGAADSNSDNDNNKSKNVPLTIRHKNFYYCIPSYII